MRHSSPFESAVRRPLKVRKCTLRQPDAAGSCGRAQTYLDLSINVSLVSCLHVSCLSAFLSPHHVHVCRWLCQLCAGTLCGALTRALNRGNIDVSLCFCHDLIHNKWSAASPHKNKILPSLSSTLLHKWRVWQHVWHTLKWPNYRWSFQCTSK